MKGVRCKCGFSTVAQRNLCPRCGKQMTATDWPDRGKVLSFTRLDAMPERLDAPYNLVLVSVEKGPKIVCWSDTDLKPDDEVNVIQRNGKCFCRPTKGPMKERNLRRL